MKTLILQLYQNVPNMLEIQVEFQFVQEKNNTTQTNVFINTKNDFGNVKLQPFLKLIHIHADPNSGRVINTSPIYLSSYHMYDLKKNLRKSLSVLEDPDAYVPDEKGEITIRDDAQQYSLWTMENIGGKRHFIKCWCGQAKRNFLDNFGNITETVQEKGIILQFDTMEKAVFINIGDFKQIFELIDDINLVSLAMQAGTMELMHALSKGTTNSIFEKNVPQQQPTNYQNTRYPQTYPSRYHFGSTTQPTYQEATTTGKSSGYQPKQPTGQNYAKPKPAQQPKTTLPPRSENVSATEPKKPITEAVSNVPVDDVPETTFDSEEDAINSMFNGD